MPGVVGNAGAVVVQLLPNESQYNILLPDGTFVTVGAMVVGLPTAPVVKVPLIGVGATGGNDDAVTLNDTTGVEHVLVLATTVIVPLVDPTVTAILSNDEVPVQPFGNVKI